MYNVNVTTLTLLVLLFIVPSVSATKTLDSCKKYDNKSFAFSHCLDEVKDSTDRELQTWINHHSFSLEEKAMVTGRYSALKMFKRSQNNFITFRENSCRWHYLAESAESNAASTYKKCYILMTHSQINSLKE